MLNFHQLKKIIIRLLRAVMDNLYQFRDLDTIGKLCLKIDLQF